MDRNEEVQSGEPAIDPEAIEVTPLGVKGNQLRRSQPLNAAGPRCSTPTRRIIVACCFVGLAFALLVGLLPRLQGSILLPEVSSQSTAPDTTAASAVTATVTADSWSVIERRPLQLPTMTRSGRCPVSAGHDIDSEYGFAVGSGPVYLDGVGSNGDLLSLTANKFGDGTSAWGGEKVVIATAPAYLGPVLVRGHQLDGPHEMEFNGGLEQQDYPGDLSTAPLLPELRLMGGQGGNGMWGTWAANIRLQTFGCYGLQADGLGFSEVIVFQAVPFS